VYSSKTVLVLTLLLLMIVGLGRVWGVGSTGVSVRDKSLAKETLLAGQAWELSTPAVAIAGEDSLSPALDPGIQKTQGLPDGESFFISKCGVRSTGRLDWGGEDEQNWQLAPFVRPVSQLTRQELSVVTVTTEPKEELEMGMVVPRETRGRRGDAAVLANFKQEYRASPETSRPVFEKYLPLLGSAALLDFLEEIYPACHAQAHDLGKALFAASKDLGASLRACGTRCTSGCMHGVVGEAFGGETLAVITMQMNTFCAEGEMAQLHKPGNCAHALGHALMFVNSSNVGKSVDACLGFTNPAMQYYCATGVYMEKLLTGAKPSTLLPSRHSPCDEETLFPAACYRYKAVKLLDSLVTPTRLARECLRLADAQRLGCFHGLGHAVKEVVFKDPAQLATLCQQGTQNDKIMCIEGAIEKLADYDAERAKRACAFLSDALQPVCNRAVTDKMYSLTKSTFALYYDQEAVAKRRNKIAANTTSSVGDYTHPAHRP